MVPGAAPKAVHFLVTNRFRLAAADLMETATKDSVFAANVVFQIAYSRGWIMVDAGQIPDSAVGKVASNKRVQEALSKASFNLVTHEHEDHVGGIIGSPARGIDGKTLLTAAQLHTLLTHPNVPAIRLDSARAALFREIDYGDILPIAPGVVLIKAAGHTPGSQMVYVRLASGREIVLAGDVAWLSAGVELRRQKPESVSREIGEDRNALAAQLEWLHDISSQGVNVVVAHDAAQLSALATRGVLRNGLVEARR